MHDITNDRRIVYGEGATFIPKCEKCGRYVKPPETITFNGFDEVVHEDNVNCSRCGKSRMIFEGYFSFDEEVGEWE